MRLIEHTLIQEYVTPVEVIVCIVHVKLDSLVIVTSGLSHLTLVIVGQTTILVVEGEVLLASIILSDFSRLLRYRLRVRLKRQVKGLVLEV